MAKSRASFERRQREQAKKAKASAKRERRLTRDDETDPETGAAVAVDEEAVLGELAKLHASFEAEEIDFEEFEEKRTALLARLQVE